MSWEEVEFESLFAEPSRNGVYKSKEHHGSGVPIVNMGELFAFDRIGNQSMSLIHMSDAEMEKSGLIDGDLLFGRRSLVEEGAGKCSLVYNPSKQMTFESSIIRVRLNQTIADPEFFFNYFRSPVGRGRIRAIVGGATVKGIRSSDLKLIKVHLPPISEQIAIRQVVSTYDDLIATNQRRINLLEEAARRIYREWFVALRFPGHESVPVKDGVPEGWQKGELGSFIKTSSGGTPSRKRPDYFGAGIPWVKTKELNDGFLFETEEEITTAGLEGSSAKVFPTGTVLLAMYGATIGMTALLAKPAATNQACCAFMVSDINGLSYYTFHWLKDIKEKLISLGMGAAQPNLSQEVIKKLDFLLPSNQILNAYQEIVGPVFDQISVLSQQNRSLSEARNLLLPKLMSGQLDVSRIQLPDEVAL